MNTESLHNDVIEEEDSRDEREQCLADARECRDELRQRILRTEIERGLQQHELLLREAFSQTADMDAIYKEYGITLKESVYGAFSFAVDTADLSVDALFQSLFEEYAIKLKESILREQLSDIISDYKELPYFLREWNDESLPANRYHPVVKEWLSGKQLEISQTVSENKKALELLEKFAENDELYPPLNTLLLEIFSERVAGEGSIILTDILELIAEDTQKLQDIFLAYLPNTGQHYAIPERILEIPNALEKLGEEFIANEVIPRLDPERYEEHRSLLAKILFLLDDEQESQNQIVFAIEKYKLQDIVGNLESYANRSESEDLKFLLLSDNVEGYQFLSQTKEMLAKIFEQYFMTNDLDLTLEKAKLSFMAAIFYAISEKSDVHNSFFSSSSISPPMFLDLLSNEEWRRQLQYIAEKYAEDDRYFMAFSAVNVLGLVPALVTEWMLDILKRISPEKNPLFSAKLISALEYAGVSYRSMSGIHDIPPEITYKSLENQYIEYLQSLSFTELEKLYKIAQAGNSTMNLLKAELQSRQ